MEKVKVTVVTPTYNQEKYIGKCIESIVSQKTNFKFKLLISNDNSTDDTLKIIESYKDKYPDLIEVVNREKNLGAMGNFVETLNSVHTEYVALCDGDDYWCDDSKLQQQVDFLDKHKDYSICCHQTLIFFEGIDQEDMLFPLNLKKNNLTLNDLIKENFIPANSALYRWKYQESDSFKKEFPDNIVPGDYFVHLMHAKDGKIHYIDKQMSCYRRQPSGMWWLSCQPDKLDVFYDLYGEPYLRFYQEVERILELDKDAFKNQKDWIIRESLKAFVKLKRKKKLKYLYENNYQSNKELFDYVISEFSSKERRYYYIQTGNFVRMIFRHLKWIILKK